MQIQKKLKYLAEITDLYLKYKINALYMYKTFYIIGEKDKIAYKFLIVKFIVF